MMLAAFPSISSLPLGSLIAAFPCEDIVLIASVEVYVLVDVTLIIKGGDVTLGNDIG